MYSDSMTVLQGFMEKPETDKFSTYVRLSMHATLLAIAVLSFRQVSVSFDYQCSEPRIE